MSAHQYDPAEVNLVIVAPPFITGPVEGFAPGTFIVADREGDNFTKIRGVRGQVTRTRQRLRDGKISFSLEQASLHNALLSGIEKIDQSLQSGIFALMIRDRSSFLDLVVAPQAWIVRTPRMSKSTRSGVVRWDIETGLLEAFHGGLKQAESESAPPGFTGQNFA